MLKRFKKLFSVLFLMIACQVDIVHVTGGDSITSLRSSQSAPNFYEISKGCVEIPKASCATGQEIDMFGSSPETMSSEEHSNTSSDSERDSAKHFEDGLAKYGKWKNPCMSMKYLIDHRILIPAKNALQGCRIDKEVFSSYIRLVHRKYPYNPIVLDLLQKTLPESDRIPLLPGFAERVYEVAASIMQEEYTDPYIVEHPDIAKHLAPSFKMKHQPGIGRLWFFDFNNNIPSGDTNTCVVVDLLFFLNDGCYAIFVGHHPKDAGGGFCSVGGYVSTLDQVKAKAFVDSYPNSRASNLGASIIDRGLSCGYAVSREIQEEVYRNQMVLRGIEDYCQKRSLRAGLSPRGFECHGIKVFVGTEEESGEGLEKTFIRYYTVVVDTSFFNPSASKRLTLDDMKMSLRDDGLEEEGMVGGAVIVPVKELLQFRCLEGYRSPDVERILWFWYNQESNTQRS